jgi:putative oxidoreductase
MIFVIMLVHVRELTSVTQNGGWALELQGMFLFTAVALVLMGPGRIGVSQR